LLQVKDLQRELKKRGLDTSGLKAVLLQRLKDSLEQVGQLEKQLVRVTTFGALSGLS
jgi:uncharacterized protein (UPF0335 family)